MKRARVTLALILLIPITCLAQDSFTTKIDEYVRSEMQAQQIPGVALAVVKDGNVVLARGYGLANVEHQIPVKPETIFQSGSEQMWTPVTLSNGKTHPYGFGWMLGEVRGHRIIEHGGSWQAFKAQITRYVDDKLTVIVFVNQARANQTKLAHGVAAIINPELK